MSKMASQEVVVVMVPFVTQGHLNQLLHLSHLISAYNIPVHFICTTTHIRQARLRVHTKNTQTHDNMHFHELPDLNFKSPPPNPNETNKFPTHLQPSINSSLNLRGPVADIILSLSKTSRRVAVVHDSAMSYVVQDVKSIPNAETYVFRALSVFYTFCFSFERLGKQIPFENETIQKLPTSEQTVSQEFMEFIKLQYSHQTFHVGNIYDSSRSIEGRFVEYLEKDEIYGKNHWAVGPFNSMKVETNIVSDSQNRDISLQWLDKQPSKSVIIVSFGTTTTFTDTQIKELAIGLEKSGKRFLWVLRDADKGDVFKNEDDRRVELPTGFEERVEGRGLVVRKWAPQVEILGHLSTAGFVSHCGWNSCMEAMTAGVGIIAWPIHSDQPRNAFLLVDVLGVALSMKKDWACRYEVLTSARVESVVRKLMDTKEGTMVKKRAADLGDDLRQSMAKDGVTSEELDSLISYIRR